MINITCSKCGTKLNMAGSVTAFDNSGSVIMESCECSKGVLITEKEFDEAFMRVFRGFNEPQIWFEGLKKELGFK